MERRFGLPLRIIFGFNFCRPYYFEKNATEAKNEGMIKAAKIFGILIVYAAVVFFLSTFVFSSESSYTKSSGIGTTTVAIKKAAQHLKTPEPLKAIYMTQCVASMPSFRAKLAALIGETELNAVVIDIKDYTGTVAFQTGDAEIDALSKKGAGCKVADMKDLLEELHNKNIYVIGRVTVFQDPLYVAAHSEFAVKKKSDGGVWKDRKGISFVDPGARPFWDYITTIATSSYAAGFDEINFDYIRFPSDGDMQDILFAQTGTTTKKEMLKKFFEYVDNKISGTGLITSADVFGMTTTSDSDMGIGQILEYALMNFDYVCPMVYPSHFPANFNGWPDPNQVPYEIVKYSMSSAVARDKFLYGEISTSTASSTPDQYLMKRINPLQLRPWLQDNDYPVHYTADMVRKQIQATYDSDLTSWMLWDPANTYTKEALFPS
jgi:hypothetical protein